jgi:hypothetical protein
MKSNKNKGVGKADGEHSGDNRPESLTFKCPKCGCETLLEHACIYRTIIEVLQPSGPDSGVWDPDPNIWYDEDYFWSFDVGDENFYICEECDAVLEDEDGSPGWGGKFLYEWLLAHQPDPDKKWDED